MARSAARTPGLLGAARAGLSGPGAGRSDTAASDTAASDTAASDARGRGTVGRLTTLTSLRAVAALAVFTRHASEAFFPDGHSSPWTRQGATGVSFFFVLSGFVLAWSARPGDSAGAFYRRRFARIYPSYIVMLLLTQLTLSARHGLDPLSLISNAGLVQSWIPRSSVYFASDMGAWSLGCEAFFYLLFPVLLPALMSLGARRRWQVAAAAAGAELAIALATHSPQQAGGVGLWLVYVLPVTRLGEFTIGIVLALAMRAGWRPPVGIRSALALAGAAYLTAGFVPVYLMWVAVTLVPFCLLVSAAAAWDLDGRPTLLRHRALIRAGDWSYAFYLVHISVVGVVHHVAGAYRGPLPALGLTAVSLMLSAAAAGFLYTLVERPAERRLRCPSRPVTVTAPDTEQRGLHANERPDHGSRGRPALDRVLRPSVPRP